MERELTQPPDEELIRKAQSGDKEAFTVIFDRYRNRILGYLYRYVGDYQIAEDLTIEAFLSAYNNIADYEEVGNFSSWLYRIAINCAKKEFRKKHRKQEVSLEEPVNVENEGMTIGDTMADDKSRPDYDMRESEFRTIVFRLVSNLGAKYKEALQLCDIEGLSYSEAAAVVGTNTATIGTRLKRARRMLYKMLEHYGYKF